MTQNLIKILAISGSLRSNSSTNIVLNAVSKLVPPNVEFTIYDGLGELPHFNDSDDVPASVQNLRTLLSSADGILICTPEYAFGVPGSLKNALDWTVSSGELMEKPLALITAATGGEKAHASLLLTLNALSAKVADASTLLISFIRSKIDGNGQISNSEIIQSLQSVLNSLISTIKNG